MKENVRLLINNIKDDHKKLNMKKNQLIVHVGISLNTASENEGACPRDLFYTI